MFVSKIFKRNGGYQLKVDAHLISNSNLSWSFSFSYKEPKQRKWRSFDKTAVVQEYHNLSISKFYDMSYEERESLFTEAMLAKLSVNEIDQLCQQAWLNAKPDINKIKILVNS